MTVRLRVAPSPTGYVHVGNVRSALFNWLYARRHGGVFILRIDDTDVARSETEYEEDIKEGFRWLGLDWDEGVDIGGPYGTYRQSDRFEHYREVAHDLVERGLAYFDSRSPEELEELRQRAVGEKKHPNTYIRKPEKPATSGAIRFSVPQDIPVEFDDLVRDHMRFEAETIDDFVILRSDGGPTYHLASTVDDVEYRISHVARGEDILSSTPKHILLARALGAEPATYAHLPLLFGPDGKKLSKRHGDVSLKAYREGGYLPEAMLNFLSLLGWSLDADRTVFTVEEAIAAFDLRDVSKNPAVFDVDKLGWLNGEYIRALSVDEFLVRAKTILGETSGPRWSRFETVAPLIQERTKLLSDISDQTVFLDDGPVEFEAQSWSKVMSAEGVDGVLAEAERRIDDLAEFSVQDLEATLRQMLEDLGLNARKGLQPIRVAITGSTVSPPLFESMGVLGREICLQRIARAREFLAQS